MRPLSAVVLAPLLLTAPAVAQSLPATNALDESAERAIPLLADPDEGGARTEISAGIGAAFELVNDAIGDDLAARAALRHAIDRGPWRYGFVDAELIAWLPAPQPLESTELGASGRASAGGYVGPDTAKDVYTDVALAGDVDFSSSGARGDRRLDVGPAPFLDARLSPTLRFAQSTADGEHRSHGEHSTQTLGYELRALRYFGLSDPGSELPLGAFRPLTVPVEQRLTHRVQLGAGWQEHESDARPDLDWARVAYAYSSQTGARDASAHQLELEALSGGVGLRLDDEALMHCDIGAGWAFRWWREDDPTHTFIMRLGLGFVLRDGNGGGVWFSHALESDALGARALGISTAEVKIHLADEDFPIGAGLSGAFVRLNDLEDDLQQDVYLARGGFELFAKIDAAEIGGSLAGGQGPATGSMGWEPFIGDPPAHLLLGAFARGRAGW